MGQRHGVPFRVPLHPQSTIYSVCVCCPDESTPGLLQGDPAFCFQGVPCEIVPISVLEILRGENLFPPELYDLWSRAGTKPVLLNWSFRSDTCVMLRCDYRSGEKENTFYKHFFWQKLIDISIVICVCIGNIHFLKCWTIWQLLKKLQFCEME